MLPSINQTKGGMKVTTTVNGQDIKRVAKILRKNGYSYDQSRYLIMEARKEMGLRPPRRKKGSVSRLNREELEMLLGVAYRRSGITGLMIRTLLETGSRVGAFCAFTAENYSYVEREIRVLDKGNKYRDIPILGSLANELKLHLGPRRTGFVFPSPRGKTYTPRRIQQLVKELAEEAGIIKRVYPHLLRHTIAQYLADRDMPENLLQKFLGHDSPRTTQIYYSPGRIHVKRAFEEAMRKDPFF